MNGLINAIMAALRARIAPLWVKARLWMSPSYWRSKGLVVLRQSISKILDVRPRNKKDYYTIWNWMVSKRLAFAAVVVIGLLCTIYIYVTLPKNLFAAGDANGATALRTYRYNAIPLKFYEGDVRILARDGHLAYEGQVAKAQCVGNGVLYDKDGNKVYSGEFVNSMFSGKGTLYYPQGMVRYQGDFQQNYFHGTGEYLRQSGVPEYSGGYQNGLRNGAGTLYNANGNPIFTGTFLNDDIVYSDFLDQATTAVATLYTGQTAVYTCGDEYAAVMEEIGAVYTAKSGRNTLDGEWRINGISVLSGKLPLNGVEFTTIDALTTYFGEPDYKGTTWLTLAEVAAVNELDKQGASPWGSIEITALESLEGVYQVADYNRLAEVYIHSYQQDGLVYTVFSQDATSNNFVMYTIEKA